METGQESDSLCVYVGDQETVGVMESLRSVFCAASHVLAAIIYCLRLVQVHQLYKFVVKAPLAIHCRGGPIWKDISLDGAPRERSQLRTSRFNLRR